MKKIIYPEKKDWVEILRRPALNTDTLRDTVKEVLDKVKTEGDKAVREYEERFDKVKLDLLGVTETEIAEAEKEVPIELKAAIMLAQKNIHTFHNSQRFEGKKVHPFFYDTVDYSVFFLFCFSYNKKNLFYFQKEENVWKHSGNLLQV